VHQPHPLHEFNRQIAMLPKDDFQIAFLNRPDDAILDRDGIDPLHRIVKGIKLSPKIPFLKYDQALKSST
jgi:hypothetical protein